MRSGYVSNLSDTVTKDNLLHIFTNTLILLTKSFAQEVAIDRRESRKIQGYTSSKMLVRFELGSSHFDACFAKPGALGNVDSQFAHAKVLCNR